MKDTATAKLKAIMARVGDFTPAMTSMGNHMMPSIRQNFDVGGRPDKWADLKGVIVLSAGTSRRGKNAGRRRQGEIRMGGPLVLSGNLRSSPTFIAEPMDLVLTAHPDPSVKVVHQKGTNRAGRGHNVVIPPRPFLRFQQEDLSWFRSMIAGWVRVGSKP